MIKNTVVKRKESSLLCNDDLNASETSLTENKKENINAKFIRLESQTSSDTLSLNKGESTNLKIDKPKLDMRMSSKNIKILNSKTICRKTNSEKPTIKALEKIPTTMSQL